MLIRCCHGSERLSTDSQHLRVILVCRLSSRQKGVVLLCITQVASCQQEIHRLACWVACERAMHYLAQKRAAELDLWAAAGVQVMGHMVVCRVVNKHVIHPVQVPMEVPHLHAAVPFIQQHPSDPLPQAPL